MQSVAKTAILNKISYKNAQISNQYAIICYNKRELLSILSGWS